MIATTTVLQVGINRQARGAHHLLRASTNIGNDSEDSLWHQPNFGASHQPIDMPANMQQSERVAVVQTWTETDTVAEGPHCPKKNRKRKGPLSEEHKKKISDSNKGQVRSKLWSQRIANARRGKQYKALDPNRNKVKQSRAPHSEETKRKISATMRESSLIRDPLHNHRISDAKRGQQHHAGTRYKIHLAKVGRPMGEAHKAAIREGQLRFQQRKRAERARGTAAQQHQPPLTSPPPAPSKADAGLVMEEAVLQLQQLRGIITEFMRSFQAKHGYQPALEEVQRKDPALYRQLARYMALQDFVRSARR